MSEVASAWASTPALQSDAEALLLAYAVIDRHESGDWDGDVIYCRACKPHEHPCAARRLAEWVIDGESDR